MSKREVEQPNFGQKDKTYRVIIIDETDGGKEIGNETMTGLCLVGERGDKMCEIVLNENILGVASMLSCGSKTKHAVKLASFVNTMRDEETMEENMGKMVSDIVSDIKGGIQ